MQMRRLNIALLAAAAIAMSAAAVAQVGAINPSPNSTDDSRTTMSTPATNPAPTGDASLDEVVCKDQPAPTGSRIGGARVCKTNREWVQDEDAMNRERMIEQQRSVTSMAAGPSVGGH
jgi:hypothetical protein